MEKVSNILFKITLKGRGVVNFDSPEQRFLLNKSISDQGNNKGFIKGENILLAKKAWFKDSDDKLDYKIKISSDCLRHNIFRKEIPAQNPRTGYFSELLITFIAHPASIIRGYLYTENEVDRVKKNSVLNISDAIQTDNSVSASEVRSRSGEKTTDKDKITKDNTFFNEENVGDIEYETYGNINLQELQFLSCDQIFDRMGLNPDYFDLYKSLLKTHLSSFNSELGYYKLITSIDNSTEFGVKFSNDDMHFMINYIFKLLLSINFGHKNGSYAEVDSLKIKVVTNPMRDKMYDTNNWIDINWENYDKFSFDIKDFYLKKDYDESKSLRIQIDSIVEQSRNDKKEEKLKKAKENKNKKDQAPERLDVTSIN